MTPPCRLVSKVVAAHKFINFHLHGLRGSNHEYNKKQKTE
ncbi:hypothetical protein HMPREF1582_00778 [Gardnerella vaginalis JCP8151A]|nr:hypothetical protein HMPREF1582_00778 [Gardnerella vaginalis JCP8151A]